ncbi:LarC family nickel insertion protein [Planctomycetota bacterium]|nr:LarC family nickel insertion protein [Planctomycetota bacterium]
MSRHLHIDAFSGIAGDMFLGALIDLGADPKEIQRRLQNLPVEKPWSLKIDRVSRHAIGAIDLKVLTENAHEHHHHVHNHDHAHSHVHKHEHSHHHHHTNYHDIMHMIDHLETTDRGKSRAKRVVTLLAESEAKVHQTTLDKIHFHEVGAVDSIVDMLGSIVAVEMLEIESFSCGPLPISRGFVKCDHGRMPIPAPATAYLLEGTLTIGVDRVGELITPTGAALVKGLCESFGPQPGMVIENIGYGAGDREDELIPNLLRLFIGELSSPKRLMPTV